ncbi:unnamed protein product [Linum trigynum]|uniref:Uncharacterized protein n=1 Tax=Linum trigynum TaxID=586398 RepID=A0AAV2FQW9_9ROSI
MNYKLLVLENQTHKKAKKRENYPHGNNEDNDTNGEEGHYNVSKSAETNDASQLEENRERQVDQEESLSGYKPGTNLAGSKKWIRLEREKAERTEGAEETVGSKRVYDDGVKDMEIDPLACGGKKFKQDSNLIADGEVAVLAEEQGRRAQ